MTWRQDKAPKLPEFGAHSHSHSRVNARDALGPKASSPGSRLRVRPKSVPVLTKEALDFMSSRSRARGQRTEAVPAGGPAASSALRRGIP